MDFRGFASAINDFLKEKGFLDLRMHSHTKKIEMCNACLHLLSTVMIKMGFGLMHALASEKKSNSLPSLKMFVF